MFMFELYDEGIKIKQLRKKDKGHRELNLLLSNKTDTIYNHAGQSDNKAIYCLDRTVRIDRYLAFILYLTQVREFSNQSCNCQKSTIPVKQKEFQEGIKKDPAFPVRKKTRPEVYSSTLSHSLFAN